MFLILRTIFFATYVHGEQWSEDGLRGVIKCTLIEMDMYSPDFEDLLIGTSAIESGLGKYMVGIRDKNDLGLYHMNLLNHADMYINFFAYKPEYLCIVNSYYWEDESDEYNLLNNIQYQTALAALHYKRYKKDIDNISMTVYTQSIIWQNLYNRKPDVSKYYRNAFKNYLK